MYKMKKYRVTLDQKLCFVPPPCSLVKGYHAQESEVLAPWFYVPCTAVHVIPTIPPPQKKKQTENTFNANEGMPLHWKNKSNVNPHQLSFPVSI